MPGSQAAAKAQGEEPEVQTLLQEAGLLHLWGQGILVDPGQMSRQEPREKAAGDLFI